MECWRNTLEGSCNNAWQRNDTFNYLLNTDLQDQLYLRTKVQIFTVFMHITILCITSGFHLDFSMSPNCATTTTSGEHHVLLLTWLLLCCCCRDLKGFTFKLMWTCKNKTFLSAVEMSGQLTEAPPLSRFWKGWSQEVFCEELLFGSNGPRVDQRLALQNLSSVRLVRNVLDSSQWLEVAGEQLLRVAVLKECLWSASRQGRLWTADLWHLSHSDKRLTGCAPCSVTNEAVRRIDRKGELEESSDRCCDTCNRHGASPSLWVSSSLELQIVTHQTPLQPFQQTEEPADFGTNLLNTVDVWPITCFIVKLNGI